jgi:hypothetical protein
MQIGSKVPEDKNAAKVIVWATSRMVMTEREAGVVVQ